MKTVVVTGAEGFIGSHLTERLVREGFSVRALVHYNNDNNWGWLEHAPKEVREALDVRLGDIRDRGFVQKLLTGSDAVCHLAALISIPYSYQAPESYVSTNVNGTINVLQAATDLGLERILCTSTSEVYGNASTFPILEDTIPSACSPYAASKVAADQLALSFNRSFGTPVTIVRPFNTFGPRQSLRAVIPTLISQFDRGTETVELGSIAPTRDFVYVDDTVSGFLSCLRSEQSVGEIINFSSGFEISIGNLVEMIANCFGLKVSITTNPERLRPGSSEVMRLLGDSTKARRMTDWNPQYTGESGLKRAIETTIEWWAACRNQYRSNSTRINI